jgi:hypothetical protein
MIVDRCDRPSFYTKNLTESIKNPTEVKDGFGCKVQQHYLHKHFFFKCRVDSVATRTHRSEQCLSPATRNHRSELKLLLPKLSRWVYATAHASTATQNVVRALSTGTPRSVASLDYPNSQVVLKL